MQIFIFTHLPFPSPHHLRVTQELMTRVMAAAEKSHDMSCDGTDLHLAGSPNSCSTCTPPRTTLTSALPLNDISMGKNATFTTNSLVSNLQ